MQQMNDAELDRLIYEVLRSFGGSMWPDHLVLAARALSLESASQTELVARVQALIRCGDLAEGPDEVLFWDRRGGLERFLTQQEAQAEAQVELDASNRHDRFVGPMNVFSSAEEAFADADQRQAQMDEARHQRQQRQVRWDQEE